MGGEEQLERPLARWGLGLAAVAALGLLLTVLDAPELSSLRWGLGLTTAAAVVALLVVADRSPARSRTVVGLSWMVVGSAALLVTGAALFVAGSYAVSDWLFATAGAGAFVVAAAVGGVVTVKRARGRVLPVLRFLLVVTVSKFTFLALLPFACGEDGPMCSSVLGNPAPESPLPAVAAALITAGIVWAAMRALAQGGTASESR